MEQSIEPLKKKEKELSEYHRLLIEAATNTRLEENRIKELRQKQVDVWGATGFTRENTKVGISCAIRARIGEVT